MRITTVCCAMLSFTSNMGKTSSFRLIRSRLMMSSKAPLAPPDEPINFSNKFSIPEHPGKMLLEELNPHPLDSKITFEAAAHKYYYDGNLMEQSVTEFMSSFFEKFDKDVIAAKMVSGSNWPRPEYTQRNGEPYTEEEIKKKWDSQGEYARNTGTWMHYNIERYLNNMTVSPKSVEIPKFLRFYDEVIQAKGISPFRTEWRIAAPDVSLAGSIDFVGRCTDGTFALIDWKRSKDLDEKLDNKYGKRARYPIDHIDDCDGSKYYLQLNIYKYILEKYYNITVSYMAVASFHPSTGDSYFMTEVPVWEREVENIFQELANSRPEETMEMSPPRTRPVSSENGDRRDGSDDGYNIPF